MKKITYLVKFADEEKSQALLLLKGRWPKGVQSFNDIEIDVGENFNFKIFTNRYMVKIVRADEVIEEGVRKYSVEYFPEKKVIIFHLPYPAFTVSRISFFLDEPAEFVPSRTFVRSW